ncbi:MAG: response regulator [Caldithrix sp.]|nr:response regulator [Caldithrix sp.]
MQERKYRLLIIEDEPDVRQSYEDMLAALGYEVYSAANGQEGLEQVYNQSFDLVITDLNMPVMDGIETLRRIKKYNSEIEVIVITGFATIENAINAMKRGAFDYITKPVSIEHVKIVINKSISKIRAREENKKLLNKNKELRALNDLKDKFISITNHELRTPFAVLRGYFDLLEMEFAGSSEHEVNEYLKIIKTTLTETEEMFTSLSDLNQVGKPKAKPLDVPVEINALIQEIYREVKVLFEKRQVDLNLQMPDSPVYINGNKKRVKNALRELVQNGLKYTEENGYVNIKVQDVAVKDKIFISVEDSGIGIPAEKMDLIFEPFYEVQDVMNHSTSKIDFMGGGLGIGLSLVKEVIESHYGEISVDSTLGEGSKFTVILPKSERDMPRKRIKQNVTKNVSS